jgi:Spy/CpxP family protein refolding chaperone
MYMSTKLVALLFALAVAACGASAQTRKTERGRVKPAAGRKAEVAAAPKYPLSEEQKRAIQSIMAKGKVEGAVLGLAGVQGAKEFDENVLSETPSAESDQKATKKLLDSLAGLAELRLETIREVVALLTPEQKRLLRDEMSKPGAPSALLEALARVFKLPEE